MWPRPRASKRRPRKRWSSPGLDAPGQLARSKEVWLALSILVNNKTRLLVQGITGREGSFHTKQMLAYGTQVVGGVTPGKAGESVEGVPVFNSVREAKEATQANASIVFVPPAFAADAVLEAMAACLALVLCIP